jgi:hypothetical protein
MINAIHRNLVIITAILLSVLFIITAGLFSLPHTVDSQTASRPITGYAWSSTIGWISLNCSTDANGCATAAGNWGLSVNTSNNITGYAWSDNVGWITTNASGCPSGTCTPAIINTGTNTYAFSGWLKALSADNKGWDGWISLSGISPSYSVSANGCNLAGNAWGSDVVGWIDFSQAAITGVDTHTYTCTNGNATLVDTHTDVSCNVTVTSSSCPPLAFCSPGSAVCLYTPVTGSITVSPSIVQIGGTTKITWTSSSAQSCTVIGSNGDGPWTGFSGSQSSSAITQQTVFKLSCVQDDPAQPVFTASSTVNVAPVFQER